MRQRQRQKAHLGKFPGEELGRKLVVSRDFAALVGVWRRVVESLTSEFQRGKEKRRFPMDPKEPLQLQVVVTSGNPVGLRAREEERLCRART